MPITGYKELSRHVVGLKYAVSGSQLRNAGRYAMQAAKEQAEQGAPMGDPPYGPYTTRSTPLDPYPKKTYKGRLVTPGFSRRSIKLAVKLLGNGTAVRVALGVAREAFYAVQFIELGTSKIAKRPWLEPSFRHSVGEVDRLLRKRLKELMDRSAKS